MTEAEWLVCNDPSPMLDFVWEKVSDRKLRLFACACCRSMFATVQVNPWDRNAVDTAERYSDGLTSIGDLDFAATGTTADWTAGFACAYAASIDGGYWAATHAAGNAAWEVGSQIASSANIVDDNHPVAVAARSGEMVVQVALLRDIVGNPFHPVPPDVLRVTSTVRGLAEGIYSDRAFDRMPILADALEEAGCDSADFLTHCRGNGPHVRGCWIVDLILGKG